MQTSLTYLKLTRQIKYHSCILFTQKEILVCIHTTHIKKNIYIFLNRNEEENLGET